ncbi:hypothetical protein NAPIS_ORF01543 [Vairimorpha apis BRL 01]|uniref:Uncharacterized protein n=1 Tax=Vairimorpha apis BRL 01 TaxID=1037528 RepID=T0MCJ3_9MICR|nr:hypothetical protein NAPIS_ORF01543 [Vairimorpha apis BRL 01]
MILFKSSIKKSKKLLQNQNNNNFEDDLFKNIDFDCIKIENHNNKQDFKTDLNCYTDQNVAENKNNMFNNETYKKDKRDNSSVYELDVNLNISDKKSLNSKSEKYEKSSGVKYSSIKSNIKLELDSSKNLNTDKKHEIYQTIKNVNKNNTLEFFDSTVKNSNDSQYTINNNEMMSIATKMKNNDIFSDDSVNVNKEMLINVMEDKNNEKQTKKEKREQV